LKNKYYSQIILKLIYKLSLLLILNHQEKRLYFKGFGLSVFFLLWGMFNL